MLNRMIKIRFDRSSPGLSGSGATPDWECKLEAKFIRLWRKEIGKKGHLRTDAN